MLEIGKLYNCKSGSLLFLQDDTFLLLEENTPIMPICVKEEFFVKVLTKYGIGDLPQIDVKYT